MIVSVLKFDVKTRGITIGKNLHNAIRKIRSPGNSKMIAEHCHHKGLGQQRACARVDLGGESHHLQALLASPHIADLLWV